MDNPENKQQEQTQRMQQKPLNTERPMDINVLRAVRLQIQSNNQMLLSDIKNILSYPNSYDDAKFEAMNAIKQMTLNKHMLDTIEQVFDEKVPPVQN